VLSILDDKDAAGILAALRPLVESAVFTRSSRPGALPPAVLESLWGQLGGADAQVVLDPEAAVAAARERAGRDGAVLVTGSIYLLAELTARSVPLSWRAVP
jgi:dihydrofolate synthase/folylpolyglutamate synthase